MAATRGSSILASARSQELQIGCIVKVMQNEPFPADLILVKSSLPRGICYVETKNLDGETNMKQKTASEHIEKSVGTLDTEILDSLRGTLIECEQPNEFLYQFEGNFVL